MQESASLQRLIDGNTIALEKKKKKAIRPKHGDCAIR
jgi:hypothetical protein